MSKKANKVEKAKRVSYLSRDISIALNVALAKKELNFTEWVRAQAIQEIQNNEK